VVLTCDYPDYTGMDAFADKERVVQGTQISLPVETRFVLRAQANKPLLGVHLRSEHIDLKFGSERRGGEVVPKPATLAVRAGEAAEERIVPVDSALSRQWLSDDGTAFQVPLLLTGRAVEMLAKIDGGDVTPLPLPPDAQLQIYLADVDDIHSADPALLTVNGVPDAAPVVQTKLRGVSPSITRMARVPVEGSITDDYGVAAAWFGYRVDDAKDFSQDPLNTAPAGRKDFRLSAAGGERAEQFNVLPLELQVDQKLALTVFAQDGDNLNGPHVSHGEVYAFKIVTPEELLSLLYDKELNLRLRFEQIRDEVTGIRDDLLLHRDRYEAGRALQASPPAGEEQAAWQEQLRQVRVALQACAERNLHLIRKNHTETRAVQAGFGEIRAEMVNNRVDTATALARIDYGIVGPLRQINDGDYPLIDQHIGLFRLANEHGTDPSAAIENAAAAIEVMLARMDKVLAEMQKRRDFNQLIQALQDILDRQGELHQETEQEQERKLFDLLE
jgi:hypothetical protein